MLCRQTPQQISSFRKFLLAKGIQLEAAPPVCSWYTSMTSSCSISRALGVSSSLIRRPSNRKLEIIEMKRRQKRATALTGGRWRGRRPSRCRTSWACPSAWSASPGSGFRCCLVLKEGITHFETARIENSGGSYKSWCSYRQLSVWCTLCLPLCKVKGIRKLNQNLWYLQCNGIFFSEIGLHDLL